MSSAHERKKQPEAVRQALLDCAARLATERGLSAVTVQAVAEAAGVTKGSLFHHFATKEKLFEAVLQRQFAVFEATIEEALGKDHATYGCFTRAYVRATFELAEKERHAGALSVSLITDPELRPRWSQWFRERLGRHRKTDSAPELEIVRFAADGAWLADVAHLGPDLRMDRKKLLARLLALTKKS